MIKLTRNDLKELAQTYMLANTPRSLFGGLLQCSAVHKLKRSECNKPELKAYFETITAKARRSEYVMSLAYAVAVALLTKDISLEEGEIDFSRLDWGEQFQDYAYHTSSSVIITDISAFPPQKIETSSTPTSNIVLPYDVNLNNPKKGI